MATITKLGVADLMVVAETGVPTILSEIVDINVDDFPDLPVAHSQYERRRTERMKIQATNSSNHGKRKHITLRLWTTLFEMLRSSCIANAPVLASELYDLCALDKRGIPGLYFDGPRAWRILMDRIDGDGERTVADKNFHDVGKPVETGPIKIVRHEKRQQGKRCTCMHKNVYTS